MNQKIAKTAIILILFIIIPVLFNACKKDLLNIDQEKTYFEVGFNTDTIFPYNGGWRVTLRPDGTAHVFPGGDIVWVGPYKISGKNLSVTTENTIFRFKILSETEIQEVTSGVLLRLKN